MGAAIAAGVIALAGTAYGAYASNKAAKDAKSAMGGMQQVDFQKVPPPVNVDWENVLNSVIGTNYNNLPMNMALANKVNQFNVNQAVRGYSTMQPYFKQNQELIGRNAASFARGELPGDVTSAIGRAAASRGFASGIGMGSRGGGYNTALGNLNLRNLGLTSLDLSKFGTQLAQSTNQAAAAMTPGLFDVGSMMMSPGMAIQADQFNANNINRVNQLNAGIQNEEATANTSLMNNILMQQAQLDYQRQLNNAQAVQSASSSVAGLAGGMGGTGGMLGQNANGFYNTGLGANLGASGGTVTNSPYGYAIRPDIIR